ncbi:hypothetical protein SMC26_29510 [Actinomadura fulvescens]|uniref:Uncharacterized protein n=1 Tax=Actinomadura fulvescens TaxID=46160 RepID=A0ABN3QKA8_9ACTN
MSFDRRTARRDRASADASASACHGTPPPAQDLVLILPDSITEPQVLQAVTQALSAFRAGLVREATAYTDAARRARDPIRRATLAGQAQATNQAVTRLDEAIIAQLNLWARYDRWQRLSGTGSRPDGLRDEQSELP